MSLSIGKAFSFNFCSETNGSLPLPAVFEKPKKKTKSPSTRRRDQTRLTAFRNKKAASPGLPEALDPSPLYLPEVTTNQLCPRPHLNPDPWMRMQVFLRSRSTPPSLPLPPVTSPSHPPPSTTTAPIASVCVSVFPVFASLQNLCHPRFCPRSR